MEADVGHLDDVLQLARLLLNLENRIEIKGIAELSLLCQVNGHHLRGEEEWCGCDGVSVESVEGVEHVEPLHVHDRRVDAELGPAN